MMDDNVWIYGNPFLVIRIYLPLEIVETFRVHTIAIIFTIHMVAGELGLNVDCKPVSKASLIGLYLQQITILCQKFTIGVYYFISHVQLLPSF